MPRRPANGELIARSDALFGVIEKAKAVARSKLPVLIHGESGAGKELIARLIHEHAGHFSREDRRPERQDQHHQRPT